MEYKCISWVIFTAPKFSKLITYSPPAVRMQGFMHLTMTIFNKVLALAEIAYHSFAYLYQEMIFKSFWIVKIPCKYVYHTTYTDTNKSLLWSMTSCPGQLINKKCTKQPITNKASLIKSSIAPMCTMTCK